MGGGLYGIFKKLAERVYAHAEVTLAQTPVLVTKAVGSINIMQLLNVDFGLLSWQSVGRHGYKKGPCHAPMLPK